MKYIDSKPQLYNVVRVNKEEQKYNIALNRVLYLKNNYSIYNDDNILVIAGSRELAHSIKGLYNHIEQKNNKKYYSFFTNDESKVSFIGINDLVDSYFKKYKNQCGKEIRVLSSREELKGIISECIIELKSVFIKSKILKGDYAEFFIDEIQWIKDNNIKSMEEYQECVRRGRKIAKGTGPSSLKKNTKTREVIYALKELYDLHMEKKLFIDERDIFSLAIEEALRDTRKFSHIMVLNMGKVGKSHMELINSIITYRPYSTFNYFMSDNDENIEAYIIKNGRAISKNIGTKVKKFNFKNILEKEEVNSNKINEYENTSMEKFKYIDLRHNKEFDMLRDYSNLKDVIVLQGKEEINYGKDELKEVPVYSNIAAGEPIYIEDGQEDNFYIPEQWLKGMKECFILKVKGDSMIDANIKDGDFIVIRRQQDAKNNDIVAVNLSGNATLKRLQIDKNEVLLMPENSKYDPILVNEEDGLMILGKAVGIIKY